MKKKITYGLIFIGILLILTNPNTTDFKSNVDKSGKRTSYWLFFTVFRTSNHSMYIGIFKNYIQIY